MNITTIESQFKNIFRTSASLAAASMHCVICSLFIAGLAGCSQSDLMQKFSSPADQAVATNYINLLRQQKFEEIEKAADPSITGPSLHETLVMMAAFFPTTEPSKVTLIGDNSMVMSDAKTVNITYEYEFPGKWLLTNVAVKNQNGKTTIVGFNVVPQPTSIEQQNKFTLTGKSPIQYAVLVLCIVFPLVTLFALISCIRTKFVGRKWPWVLFVLIGFGKFAINWTTGQWSFQLLSFQLFSAGAFAPLYGQWTLAVALPVGAIIFLLKRNKLVAPIKTPSLVSESTEEL